MEALLILALIGVGMGVLLIMHLHLTARPPAAMRLLPGNEIDDEFFRIVERIRSSLDS